MVWGICFIFGYLDPLGYVVLKHVSQRPIWLYTKKCIGLRGVRISYL